jgi:hypothetical protein
MNLAGRLGKFYSRIINRHDAAGGIHITSAEKWLVFSASLYLISSNVLEQVSC